MRASAQRAATSAAARWFHGRICQSEDCDGSDHAVASYRKLGRAAAASMSRDELTSVVHGALCHPHCEGSAAHLAAWAKLAVVGELWELIA